MTKDAMVKNISREIQRESYLTHLDDIILPDAEDQFNDPSNEIVRRNHYAYLLCKVLDFVLLVKTTDVVPFVRKLPIGYNASENFSHFYSMMEDSLSITRRLSQQYCYDEYVGVFIEACRSLNLYEDRLPWQSTLNDNNHINPYHPSTDTCVRTFNRLVEKIRGILHKSDVSEIRRSRLKEIKSRAENFKGYAGRLVGRYQRLLVLRMNFGYQCGANGADNLAICKHDWQRLLNNRRANQLFCGQRGYIWKIEYTLARGFHVHCVWFFDASMRMPSADSILTEQIGQYWSAVITKGKGGYWNCNAPASQFQKLGCSGLGDVRSTDTEKIQHLKDYVIDFLCTSNQYVRPLRGSSGRLIEKGVLKRSDDENQGNSS